MLSFGIVLLYSCSKDSPSIPDPSNAPKISAVPAHFVQKVVIENFTMASCGQCPKYNLILDSLVTYNPDRVYAMSIHIDDVMADTSILTANGQNYYDSLFNPTAIYPSGMINRHIASLNDLSPDMWVANTFTGLGHVPSCGIAIEAENIINGVLQMTAHIGFNAQLFGEYRVHAFVVEDQVYSNDSLYDQINDFSFEGATPDTLLYTLYPLNDTIHLYRHHYVLKKVITENGPEGDPIPLGSTVAGNDYTKPYSVDLSGINTDNSFLLVYVDKHALTLTGHWIENVQVVRFGKTKDWN
jgi:hypothetical protein